MQKITPEQWEGLLRRLNDGGCPVQPDHGYKVRPVGLAIEPNLDMSQSRIFALRNGGTGIALDFALRNELNRRICVQGHQIWPPWGAMRPSLLSPLLRSSPRDSGYEFPGEDDQYEGANVLNYIFARQKSWLNPWEEVEGVLLAMDELPIPYEFPDNARVKVTLEVFDSRGNIYTAQFQLVVDRSALRRRKRAKERSASLEQKAVRHQTN